MQVEVECPICWRQFSAAVVPICLACGHSCCQDCAAAIRKCSLCRQKISNNASHKPNYSLLSLLDKLSNATRPETQAQSTQTDLMQQPPLIQLKVRQQRPSLLEGKAMTVAIKRAGIELTFK